MLQKPLVWINPRPQVTPPSVDRRTQPGAPQFEPFQGTVALYTAGGLILAGATFAVVQRFFRDATGVYIRLAIVALVLSWIPDLVLLFINEPGATVPAVASLIVMHAVTAAAVVTALLRIARS